MSYVINIIFVIFSIYALAKGKYIFHLAIADFIMRAIEHSFSYSLLLVNIMGISIYTSDVYIIVLLMRLILVERRNISRISKVDLLMYFYIFLVFISTIRGAYTNGFISELVGDIRKFLWFAITILYFSRLPVSINQRNLDILKQIMRIIFLYCCVCWVSALIFGKYLTPNGSLRCLGANFAFVFSLWTLYLFYLDIVVKPAHKISLETLLYLIGIVILQHNSVYAAFAAGIVVIVVFNYRVALFRNPVWIIQSVVILAVLFAVLYAYSGSSLVQTLLATFEKFSQATSETAEGTIGTRYMIWNGLIASLNSVWDWLLGKPMGTGYHVMYLGSPWEFSPHSGYIENLMRVGLIGVVSFVAYVVFLIVKYIKNKLALGAALLVAILVFYYPYSMSVDIGLIIGMCMAYFNGNLLIDLDDGEEEVVCIDQAYN